MQKSVQRRRALKNPTISQFSNVRKFRHQEFLFMMKEKGKFDSAYHPLGQMELITLNDKLEISSDEEGEDKDQKKVLQSFDLPFDDQDTQFHKKNYIDNFRTKKKLLTKVKSKIKGLLQRKEKWKKKQRGKKVQNNYLFHADGQFKFIWDSFTMILIFYEILSIPFKLSFDVEVSPTFDTIIDAVFITDIVISFNTSIYKRGVAVFDRKRIVLNYLQFWFWIDLIASFPYDLIIDQQIQKQEDEMNSEINQTSDAAKYTQTIALLRMLKFIRFIKVMRLMRIAKLKMFFDQIDEFFHLNVIISTIISFIKLSVFMLFCSHWMACIFHYVAVNEDSDNNWLFHYGIQDESWDVKYITALYWGIQTLNTVGYGDISPQSTLEICFGILFIIVAIIVFSITLNSIGSSLQEIEDKKAEIRIKISQITNYMKQMQLSNEIQQKVRKYLNYVWEQEAVFNFICLTDHLSFTLRKEFQIYVNGTILGYCNCLRANFQREFLKEITKCFKQYTSLPDEFIFLEQEKTYHPRHLYFIISGNVKIILQRNFQVVACLEKYDYFGEIAFFTDQDRKASAQSVDFCSLIYLDKEMFLHCLRDISFQADYERFYYVKDELLFNNNYEIIKVYCYACNKDNHTVINCPDLHFQVDPALYSSIKRRYQMKMYSLYDRSDRFYANARKHINLIQSSAQQIYPMTKKFLGYYEDCNVNDLDFDSSSQQSLFSNLAKPPKFGALRSRFRENQKKFRKMRSYIHDQEQKIKSLQMQQNLNEQLLKTLSKIIRTKVFKTGDDLKSNHSRLSNALSIQSLQMLSQNFQNKNEKEEYYTVSSNNSFNAEDEINEINETSSFYPIENQVLEYLQQYLTQQLHKEEQEKKMILERQISLLPDFDKGVEFYDYYPKYNQELMIEEYNQINKCYQFRPELSLFYEWDFYDAMRQNYTFGVVNDDLTSKLITHASKQIIDSPTKIDRQKKMSYGLIKMATQKQQRVSMQTSIKNQQSIKIKQN